MPPALGWGRNGKRPHRAARAPDPPLTPSGDWQREFWCQPHQITVLQLMHHPISVPFKKLRIFKKYMKSWKGAMATRRLSIGAEAKPFLPPLGRLVSLSGPLTFLPRQHLCPRCRPSSTWRGRLAFGGREGAAQGPACPRCARPRRGRRGPGLVPWAGRGCSAPGGAPVGCWISAWVRGFRRVQPAPTGPAGSQAAPPQEPGGSWGSRPGSEVREPRLRVLCGPAQGASDGIWSVPFFAGAMPNASHTSSPSVF